MFTLAGVYAKLKQEDTTITDGKGKAAVSREQNA